MVKLSKNRWPRVLG